jgi:hypothetical protein
MVVDTTYLYGIKTCKLLATSKRIEDIITLTTSSTIKPLFLKDNTTCKMITTQDETNISHAHCCIDTNRILSTTHDILQQRDNMLKKENVKLEHDFESFCNEFIEDYETIQLIEKTFESIQDADMMIQCDILMNDYVEDI